jgi:CMP-N-acetylneuraminic acid synthetase
VSVLGLITARGGSKAIPRKNIAPLGGYPLIAWTCAAARASTRLTRIVVSTDDAEIASIARSCGAEAPFMRPPELAADDSPSIAAVRHAVDWLEREQRWQPSAVVLLQPTSPFRTGAHIDEALALLESKSADTVVSVTVVPHRFSPYSLMECDEGGWLRDFWKTPLAFDRFRRQSHPPLFARNGPAVLVSRRSVIAGGSLYGLRVAAYVMSAADSLDIDAPEDLEYAEMLVRSKGLTPCAG